MAKILIVEDDKRTNMAICEYLKPTGHNIVSAYDGEEAAPSEAATAPFRPRTL